jgi:hypothetical protein
MDNITMQKCSKCGNEKEYTNEYFPYRNKDKDSLRGTCKQCRNKRNLIGKYPYKCLNCGKDYLAKTKDRNKFCSRECSYEHLSKTTKLKHSRLELINILNKISTRIKCVCCNKEFIPRTKTTLLCSDECRKEYECLRAYYKSIISFIPRRCKCNECGVTYYTEYGNKHRFYCSDECCYRYNKRIAKALRRARIKGNKYERINPIDVFKRDDWTCQLCGVHTPYELRGTYEDNAPELDHITPLSLGGEHTDRNVQCLCRKCNQNKGNSLSYCVEINNCVSN